MTIYTRSGDKGMTSLFGGKRIPKSDVLVEAYGSIDELSSLLGLVTTKLSDKKEIVFFTSVQKDLYNVMSNLSGAKIDLNYLTRKVKIFEDKIDKLNSKLPKLNHFLIPGGTELSSWFHVLRTVCRRSERSTVRYLDKLKIKNSELKIIEYLNRLSDLFFILARYYSKGKEITL